MPALLNPQNLRPVFTNEQLALSLCASTLWLPALRGLLIMDTEKLRTDIVSSLQSDPTALAHLSNQTDPRWTTSPDGLLRQDDCIYVLDVGMLRLHVLQYAHDHPLSGHFGQSKTLHQVQHHYTWPGLLEFVVHYCKLCMTCARAKPCQLKPYRLLKQLPVPERPWNSISIDFIEQLPCYDSFHAGPDPIPAPARPRTDPRRFIGCAPRRVMSHRITSHDPLPSRASARRARARHRTRGP